MRSKSKNVIGDSPDRGGVPLDKAGRPAKQGLYDPQFEHDSCGVGFVVNIKGKQSHKIIRDALTILINLNHQLQLVEDTFGLINDEIRARAPQQILADIEEVVVATDSMSTALEELAPYEQMAARAVE